MPTAWVNNVTIDCHDAPALAAFYAALLGSDVVFSEPPWVVVRRTAKGQPNLVFQAVPDPTPGKARAHVDIHTDDLAALTERAVGLGATRGADVAELGMAWRVMTDPEGNPFCLSQHSA